MPRTVISTGFTSEQVKVAVQEGYAWLGSIAELRYVTWVDPLANPWAIP